MTSENQKDFNGRKNYKWIIIILLMLIFLLISIIGNYTYKERQEKILKNRKYYSEIDKSFYLQNGKLFVLDDNDHPIQVPGDFSQMNASDYDEENHQSRPNLGNVYFYYKLDDKIYLVLSNSTNFNDWTIRELTSKSIGIPGDAKIKYIRISGNYGYVFYVNSEGVGKILKSTTEGEYWNEIKTDFVLNDNCTLKFLNKYGMTVDGFLTVQNEDGEKCDLYKVNDTSEETFEKVDVNKLYDSDRNIDYYSMPIYFDDLGSTLIMDVKESKDDNNPVKFISTDNGETWKTQAEYQKQKKEEEDKNDENIARSNQMVEELDKEIYLIDFENYNVNSDEIKISKKKAKKIAEIGFTESALRIAREGIDDTESESIEIKEVYANNYFTRKYNQVNDIYTNIKRKAYVIMKENEMGNGVAVYVDVTTGLIIGGFAFGD